MGRPPAGVSATGITIYRIAGSKLAEHWDEFGLAGLLTKLGAISAERNRLDRTARRPPCANQAPGRRQPEKPASRHRSSDPGQAVRWRIGRRCTERW